jgi:trimeric autotransporter adhesin
MTLRFSRPARLLALAAVTSGLALLSACGGGGGGGGGGNGGGGGSGNSDTPPPVSISGVVADGLIQGARVCYDLNDNGRCDSGEPVSSDTGANGAYTLSVPAEQAGKHAVIAIVPVGAVDSDTGTVTIPYTLKAPPQADTSKSVFISPITTIVQEVMVASGTTNPVAAIEQVKQQLGMTISPLDNFIELRATNPDAARAGTIAQVITAFKQEVAATAQTANVPEVQTQALLSVVVVNNLTNLANSVASQTSSATITAANLAASQGINSTTVATQAQIATSIVSATTETNTVTTPTPFVTLRDFRYTSASNWNYRVFTGDDVSRPDGFKRANDVRVNSSPFPYVRNLSYFDEASSSWYACPSDGFEAIVYKDATATAPGESSFCRTYRDSSRRSVESIAGQTISAVVSRIRASGLDGYSTWAGTPTLMVSQADVFPVGSELRYHVNTRLATPITQQLGDKVRVFKNSNATAFEQWPFAATLDEMIQYYSGDYTTAFVVPGNGGGASTDGMGQYADGSYQVAGMQSLKNYRVAFQRVDDTSGNARIYQCRRNATPNTNTNCAVDSATLLNTTYTIETMGDARVLKFANLPGELLALRKNSRVYVERGGAVFYGFKDILSTDTTVRMNQTAWNALRAQFAGVTAHTDPVAPVAAEFGSWLRDMRRGVNSSGTSTFNIRAFNSTINSSQTGGTSTEVRLNFVGDDLQPFARNTMYLIGSNWVASDDGLGGGQCPSNGVGISLFTLNPRGGTFCGYSTDTATSFDVDLAGKSITTTLSDMRLYGSFDFGRDYSSYGPLPSPSDPEYATFTTAVFPAGSKLRFQVGQTTGSAPQLFTASQVLNGTFSFADLAAMRASFPGNYGAGSATGGNTLGIYNYQSNGTPAAGTTGQKRLRLAFDPAVGSNAVRWYLCDQSSTTAFTTGCVAVLDSTWSVSLQGGKNVLRIAAAPLGIDAQRNGRTLLIEHNGSVYFGNEDVLNNKSYSQRLNREATNAIFRILSGDPGFDIGTKSTCTAAPC